MLCINNFSFILLPYILRIYVNKSKRPWQKDERKIVIVNVVSSVLDVSSVIESNIVMEL